MVRCPKCETEWEEPCEQTACIRLFGECISCRRFVLSDEEIEQIQSASFDLQQLPSTDVVFVKTHCSFCGSDSVSAEQHDVNLENLKAVAKDQWVGLTEEEVIDCWPGLVMHVNCAEFWKNIEAKLKEKNT